ncbi:transposase [Streptomyces sp. Li-HN-5-11]|uniref:transposase n=1 Tax=Streptomyces sp. Li-HN-5-11 TaxID=3075432 RepID=UPI0028A81C91|nr:transposase [Streptomyces sp. Li-HN-5-11]WNM33718.1 transposase [Streptomyces sp. Li-HN-5-11]
MSNAEWAVVRDAMPLPAWLEGRGGQPESYSHRQMIDAVRHLVDNSIKWRAMPVDFPAWDRVYAFARRWRVGGLLAELHDRLRGKVREDAGRDPEPSAGIIDSQSLRADAVVPRDTSGRRRGTIPAPAGMVPPAYLSAPRARGCSHDEGEESS